MLSFSRTFLFPMFITVILFSFFTTTFANDIIDALKVNSHQTATDLNLKGDAKNGVTRENYIENFKGSFGSYFFGGSITGERGAKNLMINIAQSAKNLAILIAVIYLFILVLKLLFSSGSEEDFKKWRIGILWTTIGIIVMQISYVFISTLFNKDINGGTASNFSEKIIYPFIRMLELLASFAFLAMAFLAFYQLVTAGGNEDKSKKGKQTILFALVGFLLLKIPRYLVEYMYGKVECTDRILGICKTNLTNPNPSGTIRIMTTFINYLNSFIGIIIVLLIIYAGFLVVTGAGNEEKIKKAKSIILYAIIGIFLLVSSYALFNFFILKG